MRLNLTKIKKFSTIARPTHEEFQYLNLVRNCIEKGIPTPDRTGTGTKSLFGGHMRFSLQNNSFPLLTTKKTAFKAILKELIFFVRGQTDNKILNDQKVRIWDGNSSREFFESVGISRPAGDLGPIYGFQWRHFGAKYTSCKADYTKQGVDQLKSVVDQLKKGSSSRRLVVSAWNPLDIPQMALPPCHCLFQFQRQGDELNCSLYQRSADMGLGVPFNIASYSFLVVMVAKLCNLKPGTFVHFLGDYHVYNDHIEPLKKQIERTPFEFPTIFLKDKKFERLEDFEVSDFVLKDYKCHEAIKMKMSV